jgi:Sec7-like guanine-nucleotide exchange factor
VDSSVDLVESLRHQLQQKRLLQSCARAFNAKPKRGIEALKATGILSTSTAASFHHAVASVLHVHGASAGFDPVAIGEYLGSGDTPDDDAKRRAHVSVGMEEGQSSVRRSLVGALRHYLRSFRLPGEAQQIDRILQAFAGVAHMACTEGRCAWILARMNQRCAAADLTPSNHPLPAACSRASMQRTCFHFPSSC